MASARTPNGVAVEFAPRNVRRRDVTPALGDRFLTARMSPAGDCPVVALQKCVDCSGPTQANPITTDIHPNAPPKPVVDFNRPIGTDGSRPLHGQSPDVGLD